MPTEAAAPPATPTVSALVERLSTQDAGQAAASIEASPPELVAQALEHVSPAVAVGVLEQLAPARRDAIHAAADADRAEQWSRNARYPKDTVGRLMDPPYAVFRPDDTVSEATERLRDLVKRAFITYGWVVDEDGRLRGLVVFRELLFASGEQRLSEIMLRDPFALRPETPIADAMKEVVHRHFPVYPACDADGRLVGVVRGQSLFQAQAFELSAQAGNMVGVGKEERVATPWPRSFQSRHPWLLLNLLTCFVAAWVVGHFQGTIDRLVILAAFLPVLAGQSGNTGCQALAVCLRAMTLGELNAGIVRVVLKEALLGLLNGAVVGFLAGAGMFYIANKEHNPHALLLGGVVMTAMSASCVVSGVSGATIPVVLRRLGFDPATASSIFLTTATDVVSMGVFLGLATVLIP